MIATMFKESGGGYMPTGSVTTGQYIRGVVSERHWDSFLSQSTAKNWRMPTSGARVSATAVSTLTSPSFAETMARLRELQVDEEESDRPTGNAFRKAVEILRATANQIGTAFQRANAAAGPGGAVRLIWKLGPKEVRLVIGGAAENRTYIYWRESETSRVDEHVTANQLAKYLSWLVS